MTSDRRFEHDLPALLAEVAPRSMPDYRDDIVRQTARMRQRPAWMFPERWLPVSAITTRAIATPPVRWRIVGLVALLILGFAIGLALVAGSQRHVPAPFGPAANGVVAFARSGDIFTADPSTGVAKAVVTGIEADVAPVFSPDGTHLAFERRQGATMGRLLVAKSDGTGIVVVTPDPLAGIDTGADLAITAPQWTFSPDGTDIAIWSTPQAGSYLWIAQADGSGVRQVDVPLMVQEASWLPPDGKRLIVTGNRSGGPTGVYAVDPGTGPGTTKSTEIVPSQPGVGLGYVRVSPDGSRLAYVSFLEPDQGPGAAQYRVHVIGVDGSHDITLPLPPNAVFQDAPAWSNDGTRLAITRGYAQLNEDMAIAVVPADGSGVGVESTHRLTGCCDTLLQWSPDDTSILVLPDTNLDGVNPDQFLLNPSNAKTLPAPWTATDPAAWQRVVR